jgi:hypothetical protein
LKFLNGYRAAYAPGFEIGFSFKPNEEIQDKFDADSPFVFSARNVAGNLSTVQNALIVANGKPKRKRQLGRLVYNRIIGGENY